MSQLVLEEYLGDKRCLFDTECGVCVPESSDISRKGPQGFYSAYSIGLLSRRKVIFAVFADEGKLFCSIAGAKYELSESDVHATVKCFFLAARRFFLTKGEREIVSFRYWLGQSGDGPGDGDLLSYLAYITENAERKRSSLVVFEATGSKKGLLSQEVLEKLKSAKAATLTKQTLVKALGSHGIGQVRRRSAQPARRRQSVGWS